MEPTSIDIETSELVSAMTMDDELLRQLRIDNWHTFVGHLADVLTEQGWVSPSLANRK